MVDADVCRWHWTDSAAFVCPEFVISCGFNSIVSLWSLSALGSLSHVTSQRELASFQPLVFWKLFLHPYEWAPERPLPQTHG